MFCPRILILGVNGMLGHSLMRYFCNTDKYQVFGTVRDASHKNFLNSYQNLSLLSDVDVNENNMLQHVFEKTKPDFVFNCVGVVKQLTESKDALISIPLNSLLPHRLAKLCSFFGCRLIHISTDCVFSGTKGQYSENDPPDALDLYGRSKLLGEVDYDNAITLRTSLIGHELRGARSLVDWFLAQKDSVIGFKKAVFSGLPTVEIARVIENYVLPHSGLHGVYHLSVDPITKYDLLLMVRDVYGKKIEIIQDDSLVIDRSLDSTRFRQATGFAPKPWPELVQAMHHFR